MIALIQYAISKQFVARGMSSTARRREVMNCLVGRQNMGMAGKKGRMHAKPSVLFPFTSMLRSLAACHCGRRFTVHGKEFLNPFQGIETWNLLYRKQCVSFGVCIWGGCASDQVRMPSLSLRTCREIQLL